MKSLLWFVFGIASGFVLSHLVDKDPRGQKVLGEIDARISEFTDRMSDAYHEQEARFSGTTEGATPLTAPEPAPATAYTPVTPTAPVTAPEPTQAPELSPAPAPAPELTLAPAPTPEPTAPAPDATDAPGYPVPTPKDIAEHTTVPPVSALADPDPDAVARSESTDPSI